MENRFKLAREVAGYSQVMAARKLGISRHALSRLERGMLSSIGQEVLAEMTDVYHVSADYLLGVTDEPSYWGRLAGTVNDVVDRRLAEVVAGLSTIVVDATRTLRGQIDVNTLLGGFL